MAKNPKILHRIYFENFKPFHDPFEHYLATWAKEMPDYKIMKWGAHNLDVNENEWTRRANEAKSPVFLSEYFRWKVLAEYGGLYLDADCEVLDGRILHGLIEELCNQDDYDVFFGVEEKSNGHPTAQTLGAKKDAELIHYMKDMYADRLAPLWHWRESRGLIGPQLISLYFQDKGINVADDGFFKDLDEPVVSGRAKVYPQKYFSPKFSIMGDTLDYEKGKTCVYHMFANSNVDFGTNKELNKVRDQAQTFEEYREAARLAAAFPRHYDSSHFSMRNAALENGRIVAESDGLIFYGPYFSLEKGVYLATLECPTLPNKGHITVNVTAEGGAKMLASKQFAFGRQSALAIELPFVVEDKLVSAVEVTVHATAIDRLEFTRLRLDEREGDQPLAIEPKKRSLKILHRIYFGFDRKPDPFQAYLKTWSEQLPDFEIMHWNADNLPMEINAYVRQLHIERDHAFLTDFFRWYVLREHGGTYLDADMEVVNGPIFRGLIEELEADDKIDAFVGIDEKSGGWYTAHSMASKPNSDISRFMCDLYANFGSFAAWRKKGLYFWAPQLVGLYFANRGHHKDGMGTTPGLTGPVVISRVKIYPQDWFSPLAPTGNNASPFVLSGYSENTCLCHHFACSWHDAGSAYLAYSQEQGGQSNALLMDIVNRRETYNFPVQRSALETEVGQMTADRILTARRAGRLVYGPYTALEAGRYVARFQVADLVRLGAIEIDVAGNFGNNIFAKRLVSERDGAEALTVEFALAERCEKVEFRMTVSRQSAFSLLGIEVESL